MTQMKILHEEFTMRRPTRDDAEAVHQLMVASDIAEYGDADTDLEDVLHDWSNLDLSQDAWLAFSPGAGSELVGYASLIKGSNDFRFDFYTHPERTLPNLAEYLIGQGVAHAREQLPAGTGLPLTTFIPSINQANIAAVEAAGFEPHQYHFRMQIDIASPPPIATWPDGCTLRTVIAGQDDRLLYDFIYRAFDWRDEPPPDFKWWRDFMMRPDHFRPDLWFLLFHQEVLIGVALCYDYPDLGWVRQLAVEKSWRRRGIGANLLHHIFGVFYRQGRDKVALGVEANNLNAVSFYERAGMRQVRQYNEYGKMIRPGGNLT
jgi:GNAT superfamily N-acetyltransferase